MSDHYPMVEELPQAEIDALRLVTVDNLEVILEEVFEDDHQECVDVVVNGIKCSFWWCGSGMWEYQDSSIARQQCIEEIRQGIEHYNDRGNNHGHQQPS